MAHVVARRGSYATIVNLLLLNEGKRCLIFVERRVDVAALAEKLSADGFAVQPFSGDLAQAQRTRTINAFRRGTMKTLVSTDVAARGIDVPDIELVIHAETPESADTYIHRSGRSRDVRSPGFDWQRAYLVDVATRRRHYRPTRDNWGPILVPPENYFVLGDNRRNSQDSRYWGFVPAEAIRGKPLLIYYSYDRRTVSHLRWLTEIRWNRVLTTVE